MTAFAIAVLAVLSCLFWLALIGRMNESVAARSWTAAMSARYTEVYDQVEEEIRERSVIVEASFRNADRSRETGSVDDAMHFLRVGGLAVEATAPTLHELLRSLGILVRCAHAIAPVEPLRASSFHLGRLRTIARAHQFLHHLLVTGRERLQLRLAVLRYCLPVVVSRLIAAAGRARKEPGKYSEWTRLRALRGDFRTLTDESLSTLRVVLASLAAVPASQEARAPRPVA